MISSHLPRLLETESRGFMLLAVLSWQRARPSVDPLAKKELRSDGKCENRINTLKIVEVVDSI